MTFGVTAYLLLSAINDPTAHLLPIVFFAGTLGAVAKNYRRLYPIPESQNRKHDLLDTIKVDLQLYISPLIGGLFGIVFYVLFLTGIISGSLFPNDDRLNDGFDNLHRFLLDASPTRNIDAAKAIFWAFVSGFSVRLVPNILDTIAKEGASLKGGEARTGKQGTR